MKIVMLNGQNHKGSTYHVGRRIIDKISGENQVTEFFFQKRAVVISTSAGAGQNSATKDAYDADQWMGFVTRGKGVLAKPGVV